MQIRQSDLASFQYCAQQVKLREQAVEQGWHQPILSATAPPIGPCAPDPLPVRAARRSGRRR